MGSTCHRGKREGLAHMEMRQGEGTAAMVAQVVAVELAFPWLLAVEAMEGCAEGHGAKRRAQRSHWCARERWRSAMAIGGAGKAVAWAWSSSATARPLSPIDMDA